MLVSFLRRNWAALKPTRAMRSISEVVYTMVSMARVWPLPRSSVFLGSPKYRPPVSSRTTRMSMPSPWRSGRSGQAWARALGRRTGRRLAKSPNSLRMRSRAARSGRCSFGIVGSRSGKPTEPNKMESERRHSSSVASGKALPAASMPAQPTGASVTSNFRENWSPTARRTLKASRMTSGPMPSPASAAIR